MLEEIVIVIAWIVIVIALLYLLIPLVLTILEKIERKIRKS